MPRGSLGSEPSAPGYPGPAGPSGEPAQPPSRLDAAASGARILPHPFDELPDGVLILDRRGVIQHMNAALGALLEREPASTVGWTLQQVVAEEDGLGAMALLSLLQARRLRDIHLTFSTPGGGRRQLFISTAHARDGKHVLLTARPAGEQHRELEDASRWVAEVHEQSLSVAEARDALATKNAALEAAHRDIANAYAKLQDETAARERLQQELNLARRLEAIGQLSAGVAHEINTPLQYVSDSVHFLGRSYQLLSRLVERLDELMRGGPPASWADLSASLGQMRSEARLQFVLDEIPRAVHAAKEGIEHVSSIVRALKAFSHKGSEEKARADINAALQNTLIVAQNEYKDVATVQVQLAELPQVLCSISQLNQVFLSLVVHAAHTLAEAKRESAGVITVASLVCGEFVEVSVGHDGGVRPDASFPRQEQPLCNGKEAGGGAGQALLPAHQIVVEGHGGSITSESAPDSGTIFRVRLPIDGRAAGAEQGTGTEP